MVQWVQRPRQVPESKTPEEGEQDGQGILVTAWCGGREGKGTSLVSFSSPSPSSTLIFLLLWFPRCPCPNARGRGQIKSGRSRNGFSFLYQAGYKIQSRAISLEKIASGSETARAAGWLLVLGTHCFFNL